MKVIVLLCLAVSAVSSQNETEQSFGIKGGKLGRIEKRPYTVAILDSKNNLLGNGALIRNNYVITGSELFYPGVADNVKVRVGSYVAGGGGALVQADELIFHPKYDKFWSHAITLIRLVKPVKLSHTVKVVPLAKSLPKKGAKAILSGYGNTEYSFKNVDGDLREATLSYIPYAECKSKHYKKLKTFTSVSFCAFSPKAGACPVDLGDPLVHNGELIGIFSGSEKDCINKHSPGVYANIPKLRHWINVIIKQEH